METQNFQRITDYLLQLSEIEKEQKEKGKFVQDFPDSATRIENDKRELLNNFFFENREIYISKHNRFADYPLHSHQFTELNYMVSGSCRQLINNETVELNQGELLLITPGTSHKIKALGANDILINILFRGNRISIYWLDRMKESKSRIFQYLLNSKMGAAHCEPFLIFRVGNSTNIQDTLRKMIAEYFSPLAYSNVLVDLYLPILFTELAREYNSQTSQTNPMELDLHNKKILPIIQLIEENYKVITLGNAANQLGYNKTYLGNLIKKLTGFTFTNLVVKRRLYQAQLLLNTTDMTISDIAQESGFSNKTYFYKVFKKSFGYLPSEEKRTLEIG
ncbi:MAG: helix-turn-helix domain-containing protein [Sporolactobacillus sp.]